MMMIMIMVIIILDDIDDDDDFGERRIQTKITLGIPGCQIAGASRPWAKVSISNQTDR